ncbi:putative wall-associated receptor kinase-like 16 [Salvia hispanica]|uniref:putative wall-associated receptor kinase-like 16 n=1 Tax=Salvia hispanica TaxID=49212 RepID=UPI0020093C48|nr:putative wall-associated receptor kinase-like 16 [Salvia hispanica]
MIIDLSRTQYTLSEENWIAAIGCDHMVVAVIGKDKPTSTRSTCATICSNDPFSTASCPFSVSTYWPGDGCCRAPIARGTTYLEAELRDLSGRRPTTNFSCGYALVEYNEDAGVSYRFLDNSTGADDLLLSYGKLKKVALDWRIGDLNCKQARLNLTDYVCQNNAECIDFHDTVGGYLCNCSIGYRGNPYLSPGCQEINQCADNTTNTCLANSICVKTPGSYNCSCPKGYIGDGRKDGAGCIKLPPSKTKMISLIGVGSGLGFLLLLIACFWLFKALQKRKEKMVKEKFFKRNGGLLLQQQTNEGVLGKTKVFSAKELEVATDNFNENRILGQGGQGTVYKGMLYNGKIVAIKKSKLVEENQLEQFINEVAILSQINHRNVVRLLGCCLETEVPLLVYEFMPNGTLFDLIHDPSNEFPFTWIMRLKIAADIAGALAYLHYASSVPIYHRDIKSSNILLDEKYVVKVSDFGTSRSIATDQTHLTTLVKGTFGYLDPEYFQSSQFTEKSDVYSFGVVLVELLTGQRAISFDKTDNDRSLATRFLTCMEENCLDTILDPLILEQGIKEEMILVASLAQRSLNLKGKMRPTMKEVANELESFRMSQNIVKDEFEEVKVFEGRPMMISDTEYSWETSYKSPPDRLQTYIP